MGSHDGAKEFSASHGWWSKSFVVDYCTCFLVTVPAGVMYFTVSPHVMEIPMGRENPTVGYTHKSSSVPTGVLFVLAVTVPLLVFVACNVHLLIQSWKLGFTRTERGLIPWRKATHDIHHAVLGLIEGLSIMFCAMMAFKLFAGRDRPNHYSLIDDGGKVSESRESFPSGHASFAFAGLGFLSLWLLGKFHPLGPHSGKWGLLCLPFCLLPSFAAGLVAITRTRDNWHNFSDIVAGSFIGAFYATVSYFTLYPSLISSKAGTPKQREFLGSPPFLPF